MPELKIKNVSLSCGKLSLKALSSGDDDAEVLLCLHGWLDNAASFLPLMPYLSSYKVIALDWAGHGLSNCRGVDAHYHFFDWVYDLVLLFRQEGWGKVHIVGHSMGGMVASAFASAFPEYVKSLTLLDTIGFLCVNESESSQQLREGLLSRIKNSQKPPKYYDTFEQTLQARMYLSGLQYEHAKLLAERGVKSTRSGFMWCSDPRLRNISPQRLTKQQAQTFIQNIKCPVQLIYADAGYLVNTSALNDFSPYFTHFQQSCLTGTHHVHMEQAEKTAKLIRAFVVI